MSTPLLGLADYQALQGATLAFSPADGGEPLWLQLVSVAALRSPTIEGFVLMFSGAQDRVLPQGTHLLAHPSQGNVPIFLGPVMGGGAGEVRYQAVFSRLRTSA